MNENSWNKWASVAEVVGSIAVVLTLLALISEMRGERELIRLSAYQTEIQNLNNWRDTVSSDPIKVRLFLDFNKGVVPERDTDEYLILLLTMNNLWVNYESAYKAFQSEIIGSLEWERMERNICIELSSLNRVPQSNLKEATFFRLTSDFQDYVQSIC